MNVFERFILNPKTTIGGTAIGAMLLAVFGYITSQAHCDFSTVQWMGLITIVFGGPTVVGGFSTDNGKTVSPIVTPQPPKVG